MSLNARRELLNAIAPRYRQAGKAEKKCILDELVAVTGYHRKAAIRVLNTLRPPPEPGPEISRPRPRRYGDEVTRALVLLWEAADRICSKRLVPFLPELIEALERHGHLRLAPALRQQLEAISPATVDRLLRPIRAGTSPYGRSTTRPGALLKHQIPVRTFSDWEDLRPGFFEADLVAHCGSVTFGGFLNTLVLTDVATGWTECRALLVCDQDLTVGSIEAMRALIPFPLLGLDTDNGSEFINATLLNYCQRETITFTRGRPYKKNDQCHVEQKNGAIVRRFVGYDRFEGVEACDLLSNLYHRLRLYVNFFQPSLKLISKVRHESRVVKKYDRAQTPCQRVLASQAVDEAVKASLRAQYAQLDPVRLLTEIEQLQDRLWQTASVALPVLSPVASAPASTSETAPPVCSLVELGSFLDTAQGEDQVLGRAGRSARMYRRTKRARGPQTWRARADPFEHVWPELKQWLYERPEMSAQALFNKLQEHYPGQYYKSYQRTLRRRVRLWRMERAAEFLKSGDASGSE